MNSVFKLLILFIVLGGSANAINAAPRLDSVKATGSGVESFSSYVEVSVTGSLLFGHDLEQILHFSETLTSTDASSLVMHVSYEEPQSDVSWDNQITVDVEILNETGFSLKGLNWQLANSGIFSNPIYPQQLKLELPLLVTGDTISGHFYMTLSEPEVGNGYDFTLIQTPLVVPEPHTYAMMLIGLGLVGFMARRKI